MSVSRARRSTATPRPGAPAMRPIDGATPATGWQVIPGRLSDDGPVALALAGADVIAVPVAPAAAQESAAEPRGGAADAAARFGIDLAAVCEAERVRGSAGEITRVPLALPDGIAAPGARLLLVGIGDGGPRDLRTAAAALARATTGRDHLVTTVAAGLDAARTRAVVEGWRLAGWRPPLHGSGEPPAAPAAQVSAVGRHDIAALAQGETAATAGMLARDLTVTPSNLKDPEWVADRARAVAATQGLDVQVWDETDLAAEGFGGLLAVGSGSDRPPRLVKLTYVPESAGPRTRHVVLVGKGITYDTGGLSIKPREAMVPMKTDMAGSGAVLAALAGCRAAGVSVKVTGLLPLAENAVGASSYRPGDVITQYGGTTVEVANTDAEGRLVLADALAYADAVLDPDVLIDIATLTGAATLALGRGHAAVFGDDDRLIEALVTAGEASGERLWRLPLNQDLAPALDSAIADLRHVPHERHWGGGAITAALFLQRFAGSRRWAHLDVAGPARSDGERGELPKGATGFGARLLLRYLQSVR